MAELIRCAKSGSDWTHNELRAYNISITPTSPADFFQPGADPPLNHLDPSILTSPVTGTEDPNLSQATSEYLSHLRLATRADHQESAIDDFAAATLRLLGFRAPNTAVATWYTIPLTICGKIRDARADVCVIHHPTTTLLVLAKDEMILNDMVVATAEAQVVAEAIAAFQFNNAKRAEVGLPTLETMTFPCIAMSGTAPAFYLVPVTKELSEAVIIGQYPTSQTQVLKCTTTTHGGQVGSGMAGLEFRKIALKHFLAFKDLAKSHWEQYMV